MATTVATSPVAPLPCASLASSSTLPGSAGPTQQITVRQVPGDERLDFLTRVFGPRFSLLGEVHVYAAMTYLAPDYTGGLWQFYELSNGGFYLALDSKTSPLGDAPQGRVRLTCEGNFFDGEMSLDAAGLVVTLFTLNALIWKGADALHDAYERLREFIFQHPEAPQILRAID